MIEVQRGNLLEAQADALVNTVNTKGVMGKGVALQFKRRYPENYRVYAEACKTEQVVVGQMFVTELPASFEAGPRYIINFPTKRHWRGGSRISYVQAGLEDLIRVVHERDLRSVALPALGCGNGGLEWDEVRPLIEQAFKALPEVRVLLYPPAQNPDPDSPTLRPQTKRPKLNRGSAAMLRLFREYLLPEYTLGRTEAQKLMYFLQAAGFDLKLNFEKNNYGPYDNNVRHVLERMEGHYIQGYGTGEGASRIHLLPGTSQEIQQALEDCPDIEEPLERVTQLIEGFETPFSLELLASVHWVAHQEQAQTPDEALTKIANWTDRKRQLMTQEKVELAWQHLKEHGWLPSAQGPQASA
ncbi:macro domain-containing protein [Deinococcus frigens]|uniref:type II toxin-antitoxin system antitoxin DNA ADP-ribosyl glycohydrolase DarG n=1 Tax=Deinococcus frigens TaxID=249403 RepID=UPI000497D974|nr:macro domain-containing protein [Deinococcus frigens]